MTSLEEVAARLRMGGSVFAEEEARLLCETFEGDLLEEAIDAREHGEPLEHIVGWSEFAGLKIMVGPGVFVPRRRTELLFREALDRLPRRGMLVEMCCGVAPVATAVAQARSGARVYACDNSPEAVLWALENLDPLGGSVTVGDMADGLPREIFGRVDVLVANAPYVPSSQVQMMPREARMHEPWESLDGGPEGISVQARVVQVAPRLLRPGGVLLLETSRSQVDLTAALCADAGFSTSVVLDEEIDGTCVVARYLG